MRLRFWRIQKKIGFEDVINKVHVFVRAGYPVSTECQHWENPIVFLMTSMLRLNYFRECVSLSVEGDGFKEMTLPFLSQFLKC